MAFIGGYIIPTSRRDSTGDDMRAMIVVGLILVMSAYAYGQEYSHTICQQLDGGAMICWDIPYYPPGHSWSWYRSNGKQKSQREWDTDTHRMMRDRRRWSR